MVLVHLGENFYQIYGKPSDEKEAIEFISKDTRLLRPANLIKGSPGNGMGIFISKNNFCTKPRNLILQGLLYKRNSI